MLDSPSIDQYGIYNVGSFYFANPRTYDVFQQSLKHTFLHEVKKETAEKFAKTTMEVMKSQEIKTLFALNNHDGKNECGDLLHRLKGPRTRTWGETADELFNSYLQKGASSFSFDTDPNSKFSIICWDNEHQVRDFPRAAGGNEAMHEIQHLHNMLFDPNFAERVATSWQFIDNQEEKFTIKEVDDEIARVKGLPLRKSHQTVLSGMPFLRSVRRPLIFNSSMSDEIPRELPYVVKGVPIPEQDETLPRNIRGIGINAKEKFEDIGVAGLALLAVVLAVPPIRNTIKKSVNLILGTDKPPASKRIAELPQSLRSQTQQELNMLPQSVHDAHINNILRITNEGGEKLLRDYRPEHRIRFIKDSENISLEMIRSHIRDTGRPEQPRNVGPEVQPLTPRPASPSSSHGSAKPQIGSVSRASGSGAERSGRV